MSHAPTPTRTGRVRLTTIRGRARRAVLTALVALLALGLGAVGVASAQAAIDYTQGVTPLNATQAQISFTPTVASSLVDVHYLAGGAGEQDFRMANSAGTWHQTVSGLSAGTVLAYWFTYEKSGPLYVTPHFSYTQSGTGGGGTGGGGTGGGGTGGGGFPITFQNNTRSTYTNAQIYVMFLFQATPGQWSYLKADGTTAHISHLDASAPGHLTKNGVNYPNMAFTLAQASTVQNPTHVEGGRIYVSLGSPMYIPVSADDQGWGGPDLRNPADPNANVYFDWYEYTYISGAVAYGGNTTQVDQFGFPMTARLQQTSTGYDRTVGITLTRAQVMSQYTATVGAAFKPLESTYRIVAPRSANQFYPGGTQASYLQPYIDQTWAYYTANQLTVTDPGDTFTGRVSGTSLTFTKNGVGPYSIAKPTTTDVVACAGPLASGSDVEKQFGAQLCAAFNRGVAMNTAAWYTPSAYYTGAVKNDYAGFFHPISIGGRAYAFPYDDIFDQSSVTILPNSNPPTGLTLGVGW